MNYIDKNGFQNQHIVIVTDDDSFNLSTGQYQIPTLNNIHSNRIDIIKIGPAIKRYKTDITNLVAATGGDIFEVKNKAEMDTAVKKIKTTDRMTLSDATNCIPAPTKNQQREKIQAGIIGNVLISQMTPQNREQIFQAQNILAETYTIVNQYNSLIALETVRQQNDLDRYSGQQGAYDTEFENFDTPSSPPLPRPTGLREMDGDISDFRMTNNGKFREIEPGLDRIDDGLK